MNTVIMTLLIELIMNNGTIRLWVTGNTDLVYDLLTKHRKYGFQGVFYPDVQYVLT